ILLEHSYLAVIAAGVWDTLARLRGDRPDWKAYYSSLYANGATGWQAAQKAIVDLAAYCRDHGIGLLIANYPELHELARYPFAGITAELAALATANSVPFVDLLPAVQDVADPQSLWVTSTDAHPNGRAAERYAVRLDHALRTDFSKKPWP